jgi:hypothetical protein
MVFPVNFASLTGYLGKPYYQAQDPPAMVPRLISLTNLRILIPPFGVGLTA